MKRTILLMGIGLFIFIIACGHNWKHTTIPESKWDDDFTACVNQSERKAEVSHERIDPAIRVDKAGKLRYLINRCMEAKGYYQGK